MLYSNDDYVLNEEIIVRASERYEEISEEREDKERSEEREDEEREDEEKDKEKLVETMIHRDENGKITVLIKWIGSLF